MGKKRPAVGAATVPAVPVLAVAEPGPPRHVGDYGFDPQLLAFFSSQPEGKRPTRRLDRPMPPPPLESTRLKLHKPVSKKQQQRRRRWWSSASSAARFLFRRPSSSSSYNPASPDAASSAAAWPLYLADDDAAGDDGPAACTCWSPAMRPAGHLAAAELGAASISVPYASLRNTSGGGERAPPAMPIYLVT